MPNPCTGCHLYAPRHPAVGALGALTCRAMSECSELWRYAAPTPCELPRTLRGVVLREQRKAAPYAHGRPFEDELTDQYWDKMTRRLPRILGARPRDARSVRWIMGAARKLAREARADLGLETPCKTCTANVSTNATVRNYCGLAFKLVRKGAVLPNGQRKWVREHLPMAPGKTRPAPPAAECPHYRRKRSVTSIAAAAGAGSEEALVARSLENATWHGRFA